MKNYILRTGQWLYTENQYDFRVRRCCFKSIINKVLRNLFLPLLLCLPVSVNAQLTLPDIPSNSDLASRFELSTEMCFRVNEHETYLTTGVLIAYIDGEIRGAQTAPVNFLSTGTNVYKIMIFHKMTGDNISFRYFDILANKLYGIEEIIEFVPNWVADYANPQILTANPEIIDPYYEVRVGINIGDRSFFVDGVTYNSWQTFMWAPGSSHVIGTSSPQVAGGTRYVWENWSGGGEINHSIVVPIGGITYRANFLTQNLLTTSSSPTPGGSIAVNPASADGYYNRGAQVELTAVATPGYVFSGWTGDLTGTTNPQSVHMGAQRSVTAVFTPISTFEMTVTTNPTGHSITVDGQTYPAPQTLMWAAGSSHEIGTNSPQVAGGTRFVWQNWSDGGAINHSVTVPEGVTTYTANFLTQHLLTTSTSPSSGGIVSINPASSDGYYNSGTSVELTAVAAPGYVFSSWTGDLTGTTNPQSIVMDAQRSVTAVFRATPLLMSLNQTAVKCFAGSDGTITATFTGGTGTYQAKLDDGTFAPAASPKTFTELEAGEHTVWVKDGNESLISGSININDEIPVMASISLPLDPVAVGIMVTANASFTYYNLSSASWDWGDGSSSSGTIDGLIITGNHIYQTPGVYTIILSVVDQCAAIVTKDYQYLVVYDPQGGFVTGGGWIMSPLGAFISDPALIGKANFGFVSRYKKGSNIPDGTTEFQFHAGNLNFRSYLYEWLAIAGPQAKFKGEGTINDFGSYGFMLSASDGQVNGGGGLDKFRIKIWDKATDALVYDNQVGAENNATPSTVIGGGSIVIHKGLTLKSEFTNKLLPLPEVEIYPNPFSISTSIGFKYSQSGNVLLNVYDLNGKLIKQMFDGEIEKDVKYWFIFTPDIGVKEGLYILKVVTQDNVVITKKLIISE